MEDADTHAEPCTDNPNELSPLPSLPNWINAGLHPTLLHPRLAEAISSMSTMTRLSLRALAVMVETVLEMAQYSSAATMATPHTVVNAALDLVRFCRHHAQWPLTDWAYGLWQFSQSTVARYLPASSVPLARMLENGSALGAYMVYSSYTLAEQFTLAGFQVVSTATRWSIRGADESVRLIDAIFGSTETSRALSAIINLVYKELYDESDFHRLSQRAGHISAFSSLVKALTAFACLQWVTRDRTSSRYRLALVHRASLPLESGSGGLASASDSTLAPTLPSQSNVSAFHNFRDVESGELHETGFVEGAPVTKEKQGAVHLHPVRPSSLSSSPDSDSPVGPDSDYSGRPSGHQWSLNQMEKDLLHQLTEMDSRPEKEHYSHSDTPFSPLKRTHSLGADGPPSSRPNLRRTPSHPAGYAVYPAVTPRSTRSSPAPANGLAEESTPDTFHSSTDLEEPVARQSELSPQPTETTEGQPISPLVSELRAPIQPYPRHPLLTNIARFIRYSSAAYGDRFMRILGINRRYSCSRRPLQRKPSQDDILQNGETRHRSDHSTPTASSRSHTTPHGSRPTWPSRRRSFQQRQHHYQYSRGWSRLGRDISQRPSHVNHHSFATHINVPMEAILYSSYIDLTTMYENKAKKLQTAGKQSANSTLRTEARSISETEPAIGLGQRFLGPWATQGVVTSLPRPSLHALVHYVSVDHHMSAIVLTCRGTLGLSDVLTDLIFHYADVPLPYPDPALEISSAGEKRRSPPRYQTHAGMLQSAQLLAESDSPVFRELKDAMQRYPTYGLLFCGHSLGGGVAALLAILWSRVVLQTPEELAQGDKEYLDHLQHALATSNAPIFTTQDTQVELASTGHQQRLQKETEQQFPKVRLFVTSPASGLPPNRPIHCFAYGVPCVSSADLSVYCRGLITSVVNAHDVVPNLSLGLLHDFKNVATVLASEKDPLAERIVQRVVQTLVRKKRVERTAQFQQSTVRSHRYISARKRAAMGLPSPPSAASLPYTSEANSSDVDLKNKDMSLRLKRAAMMAESLPTRVHEYADWFWSLIKTMRANMSNEKLYPPGDVYILDTVPGPSLVSPSSSVASLSSSYSFGNRSSELPREQHSWSGYNLRDDPTSAPPPSTPDHNRMALYRCLDVTIRFNEIDFHSQMFTEHSPKRYEDNIALLLGEHFESGGE
ncbi:hypothetical protein IWQ62_003435 [Dispira parvispora]|uniref:sn-1-specific diacylglycerol lipase n=1 Tax=Dispira parvispora TaxID=1520584 RepID=A0A9W8ART0_9FUNG|nr:hypothetical protein IWQ62_003435 [Dispira parvispora]